MVSVCSDLGATVQAVDTMTLEEIFVANVQSRRERQNRMNYAMVKHIILKDWYLQRWLILAAVAGGALGIGIIATGSNAAFIIGLILLISVLIAIGAQLAIATVVNERKEQTLPFLMSLPISYREYTAAKIIGNLLIFLLPWLPLTLGSFALIFLAPKIHGLFPFTAIMAVEILVSTCLIAAVALITESQAWTVATVMVGNVAFNIFGYYVAHVPSIAQAMGGSTVRWTPAAYALLIGEFATITLLLGFTFFFQSRKQDFL